MSTQDIWASRRGRAGRIGTIVAVAVTTVWALLAQSSAVRAETIPIVNEDIIYCPLTAGDPYSMPATVCAAWGRLQNEAVARLAAMNGLPDDRTLVLTRARSAVRAMLWAMVNEAARKPPFERSADEKLALDWLAGVIRQHSIDAATKALQMFDNFYKDQRPGPTSPPCTFTPPTPYENEYPGEKKARESFCFAGYFPDVFGIGVTNKPKADEWLRWANADVMKGKFTATSGAQARDTAAQMGLLGAAITAGTVATVIPLLIAAQLITTSSYMAATIASGAAIVGGVASVAFAGIGLLVAGIAIVAAIYGTIVFFDDQRPALVDALTEAQKTFDMGDLLSRPSGAELAFTLYSGWLSGQPDPATPGPVPARVGTDPRFIVSSVGNGSSPIGDSFTTRRFDGAPRNVTMQGGFWVITDDAGTEVTLDLPALDSSGQAVTVRRVRQADGSFGFVSTRPGESNTCVIAAPCTASRTFFVFNSSGFVSVGYAGTQDGQDLPTLTFDYDKVSTTTIGTAAPFFVAVFDQAGNRVPATYTWEMGNRCLTRYTSGCAVDLTGAPKAPDGSLITTIGTTQSIQHTFPTSGTWWMRVKATTAAGTVASSWFTVEVANPAPTLALTSPTGAVECSTSGATACPSVTVGPFGLVVNGSITDTALQYELETVTVDWGDGVVTWGDSGLDPTLCPVSSSGGVTNFAVCVPFGSRTGDTVPFSATHRFAPGFYGPHAAKVTVRDSGGNVASLKVPYLIPDPRQTQTVEIAAAPPTPWGTLTDLTTTTTSGLPVTFTASPEQWCTVENGKLYAARAGTCTVTATQAGDATYQPATASRTFTSTARPATIVLQTPGDVELPADPTTTFYTLTVEGGDATDSLPPGAIAVDSQTAAVCVAEGDQLRLVAPGECTIVASIPPTQPNWIAEPVTRSLTVLRRSQTLTLFTPILVGVTTGTSPVQASASSGLPVTLTASPASVCTIAPSGSQWTVTFVGAGSCGVTAEQAGDATWAPATVTNTISVTRDNQTSFIADAPPSINSGSAFSVRVGGSVGTPFIVAAGPPAVCGVNLAQSTINPGGLSTYHVDTVGGGSCTVTVDRDADVAYNAAPRQSVSVEVIARAQTITFAPIADALVRGPAIRPTVTASSGLPVSVTSSTPAVCTVAPDGSVNPVGVGRCTLTATQAGGGGYAPAAAQSRSFIVGYRVRIAIPLANSTVRRSRSSAVAVVVSDGQGRLVDPDATRLGACSASLSVAIGAVQSTCVARIGTGVYRGVVDTRTVPLGGATVTATATVAGLVVGTASTPVTIVR